jgi:hypothetical protein
MRKLEIGIPGVLVLLAVSTSIAGAPEENKPTLPEVDGSQVQWRFGQPKVLRSIVELGGVRLGSREIKPEEGKKLVAVRIEWSVPSEASRGRTLAVGNLYFVADHQGSTPCPGVAFALGGSSDPDTWDRELWFMPANAGDGRIVRLDDPATVASPSLLVAFVVPLSWDSFTVRYARPIDARTKASADVNRVWRNKEGKTIEAEFIRCDGGNLTLRKKSDGKTYTIPLETLSREDQQWIRAQSAAKLDTGPEKDTFPKAPKNWPAASGELSGTNPVRIRNPNSFSVRVGLRSSGMGKDFVVKSDSVDSVTVPDGKYEIFFQYSSDPDGLYQGDSFTLSRNGVEIQIVKVVDGNYGIRKVE